MWFRRDLRIADNPALLEACAEGSALPLFVLDPVLWGRAGPPRRIYLGRSLRALDASLRELGGAGLTVLEGDPVRRVPEAASAVGAERVHAAADYGPYGHRRDAAVEQALTQAGAELARTGSPYAVSPGRIRNGSGRPYQVYSPFARAWAAHGWRDPAPRPTSAELVEGGPDLQPIEIPDPTVPDGLTVPEAGEAAALAKWQGFWDRLDAYGEDRNKPGVEGTSSLSVNLKYGEVHPRTLLADLRGRGTGGRDGGAETYTRELAWRDFYADVLYARPESAREPLKPELGRMLHDEPGEQFAAWQEGRTGFPIVDAGMRQLRALGWVHNRVRMIVASFLVKDLHIAWQHGARHFMQWLVDGDLASNQHGWQWVAGTGTDPAPYFRVFNPTTQGKKFDPEGRYVRRWVAELADLPAGADVHDPSAAARREAGYPEPIVDHKAERAEALARYEQVRD